MSWMRISRKKNLRLNKMVWGKIKWTVIVLLCVIFVACEEQEKDLAEQMQRSVNGETQGTTYAILYYDSLNRDFKVAVDSILSVIDTAFSTYLPTSIITQFNQGKDSFLINEHFEIMYQLSTEIFLKTKGAFDPSCKPIVDIWGFGSNPLKLDSLAHAIKNKNNPDSILYHYRKEKAIAALEYVGWDLLSLKELPIAIAGKKQFLLYKDYPKLELSFDAIAQGYSVDVIAEFLLYKGVRNFLVEVGGEIRVSGVKPSGKNWLVSIEHPEMENPLVDPQLAIVPLKGDLNALAVSGNYRNFLKAYNQQYYGHSIDPRTGISAKTPMLSNAVFANNAAIADALATAFMVMGPEETKQFMEDFPELKIEVFLVYLNDAGELQTYTSEGLKKDLILN